MVWRTNYVYNTNYIPGKLVGKYTSLMDLMGKCPKRESTGVFFKRTLTKLTSAVWSQEICPRLWQNGGLFPKG